MYPRFTRGMTRTIQTFSPDNNVPSPANVAIALGSNMGDTFTILAGAFKRLENTSGIQIIARSSWYKTAPIGEPEQSDYLNACAILQVAMSPEAVLAILMKIEQEFGRVRNVRWGPRTLDLDILLYENMIVDTPDLQIPHPRMVERAFVLIPLAEIAPLWIEPISGNTISQLVQKLDASQVIRLA